MNKKQYKKQIIYLEKIFKGNPPKWMVEKLKDVYERTKNQDMSKLKDGKIWEG